MEAKVASPATTNSQPLFENGQKMSRPPPAVLSVREKPAFSRGLMIPNPNPESESAKLEEPIPIRPRDSFS